MMNRIIEHIDYFKTVLPKAIFIDEENLLKYGHDETEDLSFLPK